MPTPKKSALKKSQPKSKKPDVAAEVASMSAMIEHCLSEIIDMLAVLIKSNDRIAEMEAEKEDSPDTPDEAA